MARLPSAGRPIERDGEGIVPARPWLTPRARGVTRRYNGNVARRYRYCRSVDVGMKILNYPHPSLRYPAVPVTKIDARLKQIAQDMLALMYEHRGLGLAGPQVGIPFQLLVLNFSGDREKKEHEGVWLNPVILDRKGTIEDEEG